MPHMIESILNHIEPHVDLAEVVAVDRNRLEAAVAVFVFRSRNVIKRPTIASAFFIHLTVRQQALAVIISY